jgi:hypothetical protein
VGILVVAVLDTTAELDTTAVADNTSASLDLLRTRLAVVAAVDNMLQWRDQRCHIQADFNKALAKHHMAVPVLGILQVKVDRCKQLLSQLQ